MGGDARARRAGRSLFHPMRYVFAQHVRVLRALGLKASYQSVKKIFATVIPCVIRTRKTIHSFAEKNYF
jgi:hypothetical protein